MSTELANVELAPAAGQGIGKLVAKNLLDREGFVQRLADALDNGLVATKRMWDSGAKEWVEEPDTRSQLQAAFGIFAHFEGDPIKRVIHELHKVGNVDPLEALKQSPALRESYRALLEKAEWHESGRGNPTGRKKKERPADGGPVTEIE